MNYLFFSKDHAMDSVEGWIEISIILQKTTKLTKAHLLSKSWNHARPSHRCQSALSRIKWELGLGLLTPLDSRKETLQ